MSKRITGLIAMAAGAILGVSRSAAAQDPPVADHHALTRGLHRSSRSPV